MANAFGIEALKWVLKIIHKGGTNWMKTTFLFLAVGLTLAPGFLLAQTPVSAPTAKAVGPVPQTAPVTYARASFDIYAFYREVRPRLRALADNDDDDPNAPEDRRKLKELRWDPEFMFMGGSPYDLKSGPFEIIGTGREIYLIDPKTPAQAIVLSMECETLDWPDLYPRKMATEVRPITVEKVDAERFRLFAQTICETEGRYAAENLTTYVWDCDLKKKTVSYYEFNGAFGKDVEKKGGLDIVVKTVKGEKYGAQVLSWNDDRWIDISDKEKGFINEFLKKKYEAY